MINEFKSRMLNLIHNIESFEESEDVESLARMRIIISVLKETSESVMKDIDSMLKDKVNEKSIWKNEDLGKLLELSFKKSSSINPKIVDELTDDECRKGYTVTQKAIELSGRKDLLDKYKTITENKVITLKELKG